MPNHPRYPGKLLHTHFCPQCQRRMKVHYEIASSGRDVYICDGCDYTESISVFDEFDYDDVNNDAPRAKRG